MVLMLESSDGMASMGIGWSFRLGRADVDLSPNLYLLLCPTAKTSLYCLCTAVIIGRNGDIFKLMDMFRFLSSLKLVVSCSFPKASVSGLLPHSQGQISSSLSQTLLKLFLPLSLFELFSPLPLLIQPFFTTPFVPRYFFHLNTQKQHHIAICRGIRIRAQEMR